MAKKLIKEEDKTPLHKWLETFSLAKNNELLTAMSISPCRLTKILVNPMGITFAEIIRMAEHLEVDVDVLLGHLKDQHREQKKAEEKA
jgi:plasmid maintenance system antidote protein VapI